MNIITPINEMLYHYFLDGSRKVYDLCKTNADLIRELNRPDITDSGIVYTTPVHSLIIQVTKLDYGCFFSVEKDTLRISENFSCFHQNDMESMLSTVAIRLLQQERMPPIPDGQHWIYTTRYNKDLLENSEIEELKAIIPALHLILYNNFSFIMDNIQGDTI